MNDFQRYAYFGYELKRSKRIENEKKKRESFVPPEFSDGAMTLETSGAGASGFFGHYIDFEEAYRNESELIRKYRQMAKQSEVDSATDDIVNESIVCEENEPPVAINLETLEISEKVKTAISDEFDQILKLLAFNSKGYEIFRRWYVDSKLYFHKIIDDKNPKKGIRELRPIDPLHMRKIREIEREPGPNGVDVVKEIREYYLYSPTGSIQNGVRISPDSITYVPSGIYDTQQKIGLGYLYKAMKPANQLRMIEDAVVIYRISRAPERRVFYIDVGSLSKTKAEQYVKQIMNQYRNKLVYDASTGEIRDDKRHMSMLEDFWMPRREGGRGTEITTLQGGDNLGQMDDVEYFKGKLYKSLNVPMSRMESDANFSLGRASEITRDEIKFSKFIDRLRVKFSELFLDALKTQCIMKGIVTPQEWDLIRQDVRFDFRRDSHFTELKEAELMQERFNLMRDTRELTDKYISHQWIRSNILRQSEEEMKEIDKQIKEEKNNEQYNPPEEDMMGMGGMPGQQMPGGAAQTPQQVDAQNDTERKSDEERFKADKPKKSEKSETEKEKKKKDEDDK